MKLGVEMSSSKNITRTIDNKVYINKNINDTVLKDIYKALQEIRYGSVQIYIQDGKIIQVDKVNKVRIR